MANDDKYLNPNNYTLDWGGGVKVSAEEMEQIKLHPKLANRNSGSFFWTTEDKLYYKQVADLPTYRKGVAILEWQEKGGFHRVEGPAKITNGKPEVWAIAGWHYKSEEEWKRGVEIWKLMTEAERAYARRIKRLPDYQGESLMWKVGDRYHTDGSVPAFRHVPTGNEEWFYDGIHHRIDGPAIVQKSSGNAYRIYGMQVSEAEFNEYQKQVDSRKITIARLGGPGLCGFKCTSVASGKLHAENGMAAVWDGAGRQYYKEGLLHNEVGPAIADQYWLEGKKYASKSTWRRRLNDLKKKKQAKTDAAFGDYFGKLITEPKVAPVVAEIPVAIKVELKLPTLKVEPATAPAPSTAPVANAAPKVFQPSNKMLAAALLLSGLSGMFARKPRLNKPPITTQQQTIVQEKVVEEFVEVR